MPGVIESLDIISKTIDSLMEFLASDETLAKDFEQYLETNKIEVNSQNEFNNIVIQYLLDMKMQDGLKVLEYYRRNNPAQDEIIKALENSFCGVFRINKILSNAFDVKCLTSNVDLTIIPMVKMEHLKTIGKYDYIEARILELDNTLYILEIYDVISEFNTYKALSEGVKNLIQNPKSAYFKNEIQKEKLEKSVLEFYDKFLECFNCEFISTTNKKIDYLIEFFNKYRLDGKKEPFDNLIEDVEKYRYINVKELNCDDKYFLENASGGFSTHNEIYDVALWIDKKRGLYIIPFLKTFFEIFKNQDIEGAKSCIKEFLTSDKIPPSVIKYAQENNKNFFEVINKALNTNFKTLEEILFNTKASFVESGVFSPVTVLFNSELFSKMLELTKTADTEKNPPKIGRNDPCPCGSGLKYKNCCAKKDF